MPSLAVVVRANGDPERLVPAIRHELRAIDSAQPIYNVRTVDQIVSRATAQPRVQALLVGMLAAAAIALAAFGTYSMITYVMRQRRQEIAVRMALGATQSDISRMLIGTGLRYALPGTAVGLAGAFLFAQVLSTCCSASAQPTSSRSRCRRWRSSAWRGGRPTGRRIVPAGSPCHAVAS